MCAGSQCLCLGCHLLALVSKDSAAELFMTPRSQFRAGVRLGGLGNYGRCSSVLEVTGLGLSYWIQKDLSLKG